MSACSSLTNIWPICEVSLTLHLPRGLWSVHFSDSVHVCIHVFVCLFAVPCHDEEERSLILARQCFSSLRQAQDCRIKVHWFLQPPGHGLKCELWLRPLLDVFLPPHPHLQSHPSPVSEYSLPSPVFSHNHISCSNKCLLWPDSSACLLPYCSKEVLW